MQEEFLLDMSKELKKYFFVIQKKQMTYQNARFKNSGNNEGDVLNFFNDTVRNLIQKNGGDNTFSTFSEEFHEKDIALAIGEKTHLMLTHPNHTISQIEKSFISMEIEFEVGFEEEVKWKNWMDEHVTIIREEEEEDEEEEVKPPEGEENQKGEEEEGEEPPEGKDPPEGEENQKGEEEEGEEPPKGDENQKGEEEDGNAEEGGFFKKVKRIKKVDWTPKDKYQLNQIFVGFKDAVEIISECRFFCDGKLIKEYHQNEMIRESFAYNSIKTRDSKITAPHSHSLWENVEMMSPNVCGVFIPLEKFKWSENHKQTFVPIKMELIIPFTDQLVLQAWRLYPNAIIGEIVEEIRTSLEGLVWCQIQPKNVAQIRQFWENNTDLAVPGMFEANIPKRFIQIGQEGKIIKTITGNEALRWPIKNNTLIVNRKKKPMITKGRTNCFGFGVKPAVVDGLLEIFNEEIYIPAQELTRHIFEQKHTEKGIVCSKIVPLRNATNITMMFPRNYHDTTCFQNPMYKNVQLLIDKKVYPQQEFENTWDGRFVQYQLYANELDGVEATKEFMESISRPINNIYDHSLKRFYSTTFDNTSFGLNFQLERGNAGYVFDGIDTGCRGVKIEFRGDRIDIDENVKLGDNDTYLYPATYDNGDVADAEYQPQIPPPEMWICSDTFWTWSAENGVEYHKEGLPVGYE